MLIFISWSGERSEQCAKLFHKWLPLVIQSLEPWISSEDIRKGSRGGDEISQKLEQANFGIVCLTPQNRHNEWIHFEAGALSKKLDHSSLCTFLIDLKPSDVERPLGQFQHTQGTKQEILKLVEAINARVVAPLRQELLESTFEAFWPHFEKSLAELPQEIDVQSPTRPDRELLEELLNLVRGGAQNPASQVTDLRRRQLFSLMGFADGVMQAKNFRGSVRGALRNNMYSLLIEVEGERVEIESPVGDMPAARNTIIETILRHSPIQDDLPLEV